MSSTELWSTPVIVPTLAYEDVPRAIEWLGAARIYHSVDLEGHRWESSQAGVDLAAADWRLPPGLTPSAGE